MWGGGLKRNQESREGGTAKERHTEANTHQIEKNGQLFAQQCNC